MDAARAQSIGPARRAELHSLLARLADGDRSAFTPAFSALWPVVRAFALRALPAAADAEDAAQAVLLRVFSRASEFDPAREAMPWVLGIAAWECRSERKRAARRREEPLTGAPELAGAQRSPEATVIEKDLHDAALALLGELRPQEAETILLLSRGERPGIGAAAFRKRVQRALGRLRAAWKDRHGE